MVLMSIINTIFEGISSGISKVLDKSESKKDREASYKLKEFEFYKNNYDAQIKSIYDRWYELLYSSLNAGKSNVASENQNTNSTKIKNEFQQLQKDTVKYGGTETGKALAVFNQVGYRVNKGDTTKFAYAYAICFLLSTIKREALGQELSSDTFLKILLNDYDESSLAIKEGRDYVIKVWKELFPKEKIKL